jgi:hypothetical protein
MRFPPCCHRAPASARPAARRAPACTAGNAPPRAVVVHRAPVPFRRPRPRGKDRRRPPATTAPRSRGRHGRTGNAAGSHALPAPAPASRAPGRRPRPAAGGRRPGNSPPGRSRLAGTLQSSPSPAGLPHSSPSHELAARCRPPGAGPCAPSAAERHGAVARALVRDYAGCSSSANGTCGRSLPSTRPITTDGGPIAAVSSALPAPVTLPPILPRNGPSVGLPSAPSSANTSGGA